MNYLMIKAYVLAACQSEIILPFSLNSQNIFYKKYWKQLCGVKHTTLPLTSFTSNY